VLPEHKKDVPNMTWMDLIPLVLGKKCDSSTIMRITSGKCMEANI
jgi:hypothetical protein